MKKKVWILILVLTLGFLGNSVFASNNYMINLFYAIESSKSYGDIKGTMVGNNNHMYYQWARLTPNEDGLITFTNKYRKGISEFDNRYLEYGVPNNSTTGYTNKVDFNKNFPKGKAYLSVFFENYLYGESRSSAIEFLNMTENQWTTEIIEPMVSMINGIYNDQTDENLAFDGVVLDFEGFRNQLNNENYSLEKRSGLKEKYNKFIKKLDEALGDKELIICVHPSNVEGFFDGYDYKFISDNADYMILMAYNYYDADKYQNPQEDIENVIKFSKENIYDIVHRPETQPYDKVKQAVDELVNKYSVAKDKLILGLDIAGMKWIKLNKTIEDKTYQYYVMRRPDLDGIEEAVKSERVYIEESRTNKKVLMGEEVLEKDRQEFEKENISVEKVEYYYESPESLNKKYYEILKEYNIAGLSVWRLGTGSTKSLKSLYEIHYDNEIKIWDNRVNISKDKVWNIKFNLSIDGNTVNEENIYVTDKYGEKVDISLDLIIDNDKGIVQVKPLKSYESGQTYNLYITKGLKSTSEKVLSKGLKMRFTINQEE